MGFFERRAVVAWGAVSKTEDDPAAALPPMGMDGNESHRVSFVMFKNTIRSHTSPAALASRVFQSVGGFSPLGHVVVSDRAPIGVVIVSIERFV